MSLEKINQIRKQRGMSVEDLAKTARLPLSTVSKINAGITKNPNLETVKALAKALGCTIDDFDDDPISPSSTDPRLQRLTDNYSRLNDTGKGKLVSYSDDLAANPANTTDEPRFRPQIAAEGGVRAEEIPMVTQADKEKAEDAMLRLKIREMFGDEDE